MIDVQYGAHAFAPRHCMSCLAGKMEPSLFLLQSLPTALLLTQPGQAIDHGSAVCPVH